MSRTVEDATRAIKPFIPILQDAKHRTISEADTRTITHKFLNDVLGYDFIGDITKEFAIRGTYADFGVKIDGDIKFIVEAKEIGTKLRDIHMRQAMGYAVQKGVPWCVLTDGAVWRLYRIEFEQPVQTTLVFEIDLLSLPPSEAAQLLWLLSKHSMSRGEIDQFWQKRKCLNDATLLKAVFSQRGFIAIRRELRAITGILISLEELGDSLQNLLSEKSRLILEESKIKPPAKRRRRRTKRTVQTDAESGPAQGPSEPPSEYGGRSDDAGEVESNV